MSRPRSKSSHANVGLTIPALARKYSLDENTAPRAVKAGDLKTFPFAGLPRIPQAEIERFEAIFRTPWSNPMNEVLEKTRPAKLSLIASMAAKYEMEPNAFADAVRKTAMPSTATNEEFAAFLMVAKEYRLNPLLHEIHAFPKRGGGITPVVSIDGWISLVNQHPAMNGMEFDYHENKNNQLVACTCRLYRKDRDRAIEVTEYLVECFRNTEPWKIAPKRMLRHKALIQAARYAFGFSGIYDDDEAQRINDMRDVSPKPVNIAAKDSSQLDRWANTPAPDASNQVEEINMDTGEITEPSAADAEKPAAAKSPHARGRADRDANKALRACPPEWRDGNHADELDQWETGWKARDEEITAAAKQ